MPKLKVPRKSTLVDMTPMVDMGFLLVTFFMLTTQMRPDEPVEIKKPSSIATILIPSKDIMTITVSDSGKVFFDIQGKYVRQTLIKKMGDQFHVDFTPDEINTYAVLGMVGVPMSEMKQFLDMSPEQRKQVKQPGIPVDTTGGELQYWVRNGRESDQSATVTIQGDAESNYKGVKAVINTLQDQQVNIFSLITNKEAPPPGYIPDQPKTATTTTQ